MLEVNTDEVDVDWYNFYSEANCAMDGMVNCMILLIWSLQISRVLGLVGSEIFDVLD